jgi:hypothetical protein
VPSADLSAIVAAVREDRYLISTHYLRERAGEPGRPLPSTIRACLAEDAPRIVRDDEGANDPRGATCRIQCITPGGDVIFVVVAYDNGPVRVVTAYAGR